MKLILYIGKENFKNLLKKYNLKCIIMIFTDGPVVPGSGIVFGGPYEGFTAPSKPGETDKELLIKTHLAVFKVRNWPPLISYISEAGFCKTVHFKRLLGASYCSSRIQSNQSQLSLAQRLFYAGNG